MAIGQVLSPGLFCPVEGKSSVCLFNRPNRQWEVCFQHFAVFADNLAVSQIAAPKHLANHLQPVHHP